MGGSTLIGPERIAVLGSIRFKPTRTVISMRSATWFRQNSKQISIAANPSSLLFSRHSAPRSDLSIPMIIRHLTITPCCIGNHCVTSSDLFEVVHAWGSQVSARYRSAVQAETSPFRGCTAVATIATVVEVRPWPKARWGTAVFFTASNLHSSRLHDKTTLEGGVIVTVGRLLPVDSTSRSFQAPRRSTQRVSAHARHQTLQTLPLSLYSNAYGGLTVRWYTPSGPNSPA